MSHDTGPVRGQASLNSQTAAPPGRLSTPPVDSGLGQFEAVLSGVPLTLLPSSLPQLSTLRLPREPCEPHQPSVAQQVPATLAPVYRWGWMVFVHQIIINQSIIGQSSKACRGPGTVPGDGDAEVKEAGLCS